MQVVELLSALAHGKRPIAVVATIHQPSIKVFNMFERVIAIGMNSKIVYDGTPGELAGTMNMVGLDVPKMSSPADFLIEVS